MEEPKGTFNLTNKKKCFVKQFYKIHSGISKKYQFDTEQTVTRKKEIDQTLKQSLKKLDQLVKSIRHKK